MSSDQSEGEIGDKFSDINDNRSVTYEEFGINNFNTNAESNTNIGSNSVGRIGSNNTAQLSNIVISNREISDMSNINRLQEQLINDNASETELVNNNLNDLLDSMTFLINEERNKIKGEKGNLIKANNSFKEQQMRQITKHDKEVEEWKKNLQIAEGMDYKPSDLFDLDIGGTEKMSTTRATLRKYPNSVLAAMFSGKHRLPMHNGRVFIDRDGKSFLSMIQFLRNGRVPSFANDCDRQNFFEEIDYWRIPLEDPNSLVESRFVFDPDWCARTLNIESKGKVVRKSENQHGIIFLKPEIDEENSFFEIKVNVKVPSRGKSHLFIGLVDKSKYVVDNLLSTFWKDSPSAYYWDAWNSKLIKTDENGVQIGTHPRYGCQCEDFITKFAIKYDVKLRTIEFYKNNSNLGVAFRNVPKGLTPSLDIWFLNGSIEILSNRAIEEKIYL